MNVPREEKTFNVRVEGDWDFTEAEMWPDGPPDNPTREDAIARIRDEIKTLGFQRFLNEWNLTDDMSVEVEHVTVHPEWLARAYGQANP